MYNVVTYPTLAIAVAVGLFAIVWGALGKKPNDYTLGGGALVVLALVIMVPVAIVAGMTGNEAVGDLLEYWMYHITAIVMMAGATLWTLIERNRWSPIVMGIGALAAAIMVFRMSVIWSIG